MEPMQRRYWDGLSARYQRVMEISTDDFHYGPQIPGESRLHLLPPLKSGMRALELGCGGGQNSVWLAKQGFYKNWELAVTRALFFFPLLFGRKYKVILLAGAICFVATLWPAWVYRTSPFELILQVPKIAAYYSELEKVPFEGMYRELDGFLVPEIGETSRRIQTWIYEKPESAT